MRELGVRVYLYSGKKNSLPDCRSTGPVDWWKPRAISVSIDRPLRSTGYGQEKYFLFQAIAVDRASRPGLCQARSVDRAGRPAQLKH